LTALVIIFLLCQLFFKIRHQITITLELTIRDIVEIRLIFTFIRWTVSCSQQLYVQLLRGRQKKGGHVTETVKYKGFVFDYWTLYHFFWPYIFLCQASQGLRAIQHHRPAFEKEAGTMVPAGPYPDSGDTAGASLTNCPCLAAWESGDYGNCIFRSNCICHMWVCCCGARSEALLSDVLNQTAELSPAPQEGDVQEEACKEGNKLCRGTKHQQSSSGAGHRGHGPDGDMLQVH